VKRDLSRSKTYCETETLDENIRLVCHTDECYFIVFLLLALADPSRLKVLHNATTTQSQSSDVSPFISLAASTGCNHTSAHPRLNLLEKDCLVKNSGGELRCRTVGLDFLFLYPAFPLFSISFSPKFNSCPVAVVSPRGIIYIKTDARPPESSESSSVGHETRRDIPGRVQISSRLVQTKRSSRSSLDRRPGRVPGPEVHVTSVAEGESVSGAGIGCSI
jgi:hypothetical protein